MKKSAILLAALGLGSLATAETLNCKVTFNGDEIVRASVEVAVNEKKTFFEHEGDKYSVKNYGNSKFSVETFYAGDWDNSSVSSSEGYLRQIGDNLVWSYWSREILMVFDCALVLAKP